jgi:hypothetical protein
MADVAHKKSEKAEQLLRLLYEVHPQSFDTSDVVLMWMLGRLDTPNLQEPTKRLIRSFDVTSDHRPEVLYSIGLAYATAGDRLNSIKYYRLLADRPGFNDEWYKINGSLMLGRAYISAGDQELGRTYIWQSALESRGGGFDSGYMRDLVQELRQPDRGLMTNHAHWDLSSGALVGRTVPLMLDDQELPAFLSLKP